MSRTTFDISRPPLPVEGCKECTEYAQRRRQAQASYDLSRVTDLNVLMRHHQRREHGR